MILDCHVHFHGRDAYGKMLDDQRRTGVDGFNIVVTPRLPGRADPPANEAALWFKGRHPEMVTVFGGLDYAGLAERGRPDVPLVEQVESLRAAGCEGVKMLCGKPDCRRTIGHAMDGELYAPLLAHLEAEGIPLLWHVADPPEFWTRDAVPLWARQQNWWYDESFPPKVQLDAEALNALRGHPGLKVILAHFFFLSQDLPAAERLLAELPNVHLDLAPGVEMFHNFSRDPEAARAFFVRRADRILYGTDIGAARHRTGPKRGWMVRHWLETDDVFDVPDDPLMTPDDRPALRGIALGPGELERIYAANFQRILGRG